jgi:hypothetical protein
VVTIPHVQRSWVYGSIAVVILVAAAIVIFGAGTKTDARPANVA